MQDKLDRMKRERDAALRERANMGAVQAAAMRVVTLATYFLMKGELTPCVMKSALLENDLYDVWTEVALVTNYDDDCLTEEELADMTADMIDNMLDEGDRKDLLAHEDNNAE